MEKACKRLNKRFENVWISESQQTLPHDIATDNLFLNAVAFVETKLNQQELKTLFNQWEIEQGRDRNHPDSSLRDREIDLDILFSYHEYINGARVSEDYILPQFNQLLKTLTEQDILERINTP